MKIINNIFYWLINRMMSSKCDVKRKDSKTMAKL